MKNKEALKLLLSVNLGAATILLAILAGLFGSLPLAIAGWAGFNVWIFTLVKL